MHTYLHHKTFEYDMTMDNAMGPVSIPKLTQEISYTITRFEYTAVFIL